MYNFKMYNLKTYNFSKVLAIILVIMCGVTGCSKENVEMQTSQEATDTTGNDTIEQNLPVYNVSMNNSYPPFEFIGTEGGLDGFDVELLNAVAERGGFSVQYQPYKSTDFEKIIQSVADGTVDMSASSIFITPERQETFGFSQPYFTLPVYFVGLDTPERPTTVEEVEGKTIAVDNENFILKSILEQSFETNNNVINYTDSTYLAFKSMLLGESDLMLENIMTIDDYSQDIADKELFYMRLPDDYSIQLGYLTRKDDQELLDKLNLGIRAVQADGKYDEIYDKWFGELESKVAERTVNHSHP